LSDDGVEQGEDGPQPTSLGVAEAHPTPTPRDGVDRASEVFDASWCASNALEHEVQTVAAVPASSFANAHQIDNVRRRLGRIGSGNMAGASRPPGQVLQFAPTTAKATAHEFPLELQTRKVDAQRRIKVGLDDGNLVDLLGWTTGALNVQVNQGWLILTQHEQCANASGRRNHADASYSMTATGTERLQLRNGHLASLGVEPGRHVLVTPIPESRCLVIVKPAVCVTGAPNLVTECLPTTQPHMQVQSQ
jgi:hypothetical protein